MNVENMFLHCTNCNTDNPEGMNFCGNCGVPLTSQEMTPERRLVTVMFSDLENFTEFSSHHHEEDIPGILAIYQDVVRQQVEKSRGFIAQFLGDGVLIYFGYPNAMEDAATHAVDAALHIVEAIESLNKSGDFPLKVRIGIHHGSGIMSRIGDRENLLLGVTSNIASRLQQLASPNSIVISSEVDSLLGDNFETVPIGERQIKGVETPFELFSVVQRLKHGSRFDRSIAKGLSVFTGRSEEMSRLNQYIGAPTNGQHSILIKGEPGIGKSRLIHELTQLSQLPFSATRCNEQMRESPYYALVDVLSALYDVPKENLANQLEQRVSDDLQDELRLLTDGSTEGELTVAGAIEVLSQLLIAQSGRKIIVIEDLHWIDAASLEVLREIPQRCPYTFFIMSARTEFEESWEDEIDLDPLTKQSTLALLTQLLGGHKPSTEFGDVILQKTNGIPLFVEELYIALQDEGVLSENNDTVSLSTESVDWIPATLTELLTSRIDRLGSAKNVIQRASVIGLEFDLSLLESIYEGSSDELETALDTLVHDGLIRPTEDDKYLIKHGLVRDAAYNSMVRSQRHRMHRSLAQALEGRLRVTGSVPPELIAQHWELGEEPRLAIEYFRMAGQNMIGRAFHGEARRHTDRALDLLTRLPPSRDRDELEFSLLLLLGTTIRSTEGYVSDNMLRVYQPAMKLSERLGENTDILPVIYGGWTYNFASNKKSEVLNWVERFDSFKETLSEELPEHIDVAGEHIHGITSFAQGNFEKAERHLRRAMDIYSLEQHDSLMQLYGEDLGLYAVLYLQWMYTFAGRIDEAYETSDYSTGLAMQIQDPLASIMALTFRIHVTHDSEDHATSAQLCRRLIEQSREFDFLYYESIGKEMLNWNRMHLGEIRIDDDLEYDAGGFVEDHNQTLFVAATYRNFAKALIRIGKYDEADRYIESALELAETSIDVIYQPEVHRVKGNILRRQGDEVGAEQCYQTGIKMAREFGAGYWESSCSLELARLYSANGEPDQALCLLDPIVEKYCPLGECSVYKQVLDLATELTAS